MVYNFRSQDGKRLAAGRWLWARQPRFAWRARAAGALIVVCRRLYAENIHGSTFAEVQKVSVAVDEQLLEASRVRPPPFPQMQQQGSRRDGHSGTAGAQHKFWSQTGRRCKR